MSFKTYYNIITDCVLHLALNNIDEILKSNVEKSYFFLMNHPQSVKCQLIKFLLVFSPNCFPPKILSILPAVQYYLIELIIKWLFFCLSCTILLSQLLPFWFTKGSSLLISGRKWVTKFICCSNFSHHFFYPN